MSAVGSTQKSDGSPSDRQNQTIFEINPNPPSSVSDSLGECPANSIDRPAMRRHSTPIPGSLLAGSPLADDLDPWQEDMGTKSDSDLPLSRMKPHFSASLRTIGRELTDSIEAGQKVSEESHKGGRSGTDTGKAMHYLKVPPDKSQDNTPKSEGPASDLSRNRIEPGQKGGKKAKRRKKERQKAENAKKEKEMLNEIAANGKENNDNSDWQLSDGNNSAAATISEGESGVRSTLPGPIPDLNESGSTELTTVQTAEEDPSMLPNGVADPRAEVTKAHTGFQSDELDKSLCQADEPARESESNSLNKVISRTRVQETSPPADLGYLTKNLFLDMRSVEAELRLLKLHLQRDNIQPEKARLDMEALKAAALEITSKIVLTGILLLPADYILKQKIEQEVMHKEMVSRVLVKARQYPVAKEWTERAMQEVLSRSHVVKRQRQAMIKAMERHIIQRPDFTSSCWTPSAKMWDEIWTLLMDKTGFEKDDPERLGSSVEAIIASEKLRTLEDLGFSSAEASARDGGSSSSPDVADTGATHLSVRSQTTEQDANGSESARSKATTMRSDSKPIIGAKKLTKLKPIIRLHLSAAGKHVEERLPKFAKLADAELETQIRFYHPDLAYRQSLPVKDPAQWAEYYAIGVALRLERIARASYKYGRKWEGHVRDAGEEGKDGTETVSNSRELGKRAAMDEMAVGDDMVALTIAMDLWPDPKNFEDYRSLYYGEHLELEPNRALQWLNGDPDMMVFFPPGRP